MSHTDDIASHRGLFGRARRRDASAESVVAAAPSTVWNFVSDVGQIGRWWPRAVGGEVLEGEGSGRRQLVRLAWGRQEGRVRQQVTAWEPGARYGWKIVSEAAGDRVLTPLAVTTITVTILREGQLSRVRIDASYEPIGTRGALALRQLGRTSRATFKKALKNLQAALLQ